MKLPFIIIVDDDMQVLRAIQRDIKNEYGNGYRVTAIDSAKEALELMKELKLKNEVVALIISDQRMPEMEGIDFLIKAKEIYGHSKQILLTAYSDIDAAITAINDVKLDYYLLKPWNPPEEKLYPVVNELLEDWHAFYKPVHDGIRIIGFQWSPDSHHLKEFLSGNLIPYLWIDVEHNEEAEKYITSTNITKSDLPLIVFQDGSFLSSPKLNDVAMRAGLRQVASAKMYDVVIIGAGPAGLAASLYGSSEGLKTLLIEKKNPGGQASSSARIENYLGFPNGLSGGELTRRALAQTQRFGTEILTPAEVKSIHVKDGYKIIVMADDSEIITKTIVIATGVAYRKLEIAGLENFTGAGVYYGAAAIEAHACRKENIYIVGGGNSACQAALYMCKFANEVNMIIRQDILKQAAANYLVELITKTPNINIIPITEVISVAGSNMLEQITLRNMKTTEEQTVNTKALFIYIGARPGTEWLNDIVMKDDKGFIITGRELINEKSFHTFWKLEREPYLPETSIPGIFASGDVRFGALAGISSAVGEGSLAIRFVRKYLQEM
ncbi:MAG: FAD-dependent oxidoreductase [Bacteroidia bacterium]